MPPKLPTFSRLAEPFHESRTAHVEAQMTKKCRNQNDESVRGARRPGSTALFPLLGIRQLSLLRHLDFVIRPFDSTKFLRLARRLGLRGHVR